MEQGRFDSLLVEHADMVGYVCDLETYEMLYLTGAGMSLFGVDSPSDVLGKKCYQLLQGLDEPCPFCANDKLVEGSDYAWEHFNEKLGCWMAVRDSLVKVDGRPCRLAVAYDITGQKELLTRLADRLTTEDALVRCIRILAREPDLNAALNGFLETIGRFHRAKRAYVFEFDFESQTLGNTFEWCAPQVTREIDNLQGIPMGIVDRWIRKFEDQGEFYITSLDGELDPSSDEYRILDDQGIESLLAAPLVEDGRIIGFLGVDDPEEHVDGLALLRASTDFVLEELKKRRLAKELEHASYVDLLTGLKNRNQYIKRLQACGEGETGPLGVIFVDINGMKDLNDTYGHAYGDSVIVRVADILRKHVGGDDTFRIGGDEFVALLGGVGKDDFERMAHDLRQAFLADEACDVSLGCVWEPDGSHVEGQVPHADELMYAEKQAYYQSVLNSGRRKRTGLATEVLSEIADGRFVVLYRPQLDVETGMIVGAEALVRKVVGDGEFVLSDGFVPLYEQEGVIRHVDLFVMERACAAIEAWHGAGIDPSVSIAFSRVTLMEPNVIDTLLSLCASHGVPPARIIIHMVEGFGKMGRDRLRMLVACIMEAGFAISLDDSGSEHSNLAVLVSMGLGGATLDRLSAEGADQGGKARLVVQGGACERRGAEGAGQPAEGVTVQRLRCLEPMSADQFDALLRSRIDGGGVRILPADSRRTDG